MSIQQNNLNQTMACIYGPLTLPASEGSGLQPQCVQLVCGTAARQQLASMRCRHGKQTLHVVIYQGCGKLVCATSVSSLYEATVTSV